MKKVLSVQNNVNFTIVLTKLASAMNPTNLVEQRALKNVNSCLNTSIYSYFETVIIYILMLIFSTPVLIRHLWQIKTVVFLHWCLIRTVLLPLTGPPHSVGNPVTTYSPNHPRAVFLHDLKIGAIDWTCTCDGIG